VQRKQPSFRAVYRNLGAGRRFKPHLRLVDNDAPPAQKKKKLVQPRLPVAHRPSPEQALRMTRTEALEMFEPLPLPSAWTIYATAPIGEVAANMPGLGKILRAALLLHELGTAHIAQRRTDHGTDYLIRSTFKCA